MPLEIRTLLVLRVLGVRDDIVHILLLARDEKYSHRRDDNGMEVALVLEEVHG